MEENTSADITEVENEVEALNKIVMTLLYDRKKEVHRLWVALIVSLVINVFTITAFLYYESHMVATTETVTTVTQDTGEGTGNNVYQAGESAVYNQ